MNYSYDLKMYNGLTYYTPTVGDGASFKGRGTKSTYNARATNFNQLLSYDKTIGKHSFSVLLGQSMVTSHITTIMMTSLHRR